MNTPPQTLPLSHIKVLDLTTIIAGPFCTLHLAHMGAEVIKIEPLNGGDSGRNLGAEVTLNDQNMGSLFLGMNGGKKSLTLNLKSPDGIAIFKQLVAQCDVVVENFRAGVMKKLGLDYDTLRDINPTLVYCSISGYGQQGPMSNRAAYDQIIQGVSGLMTTTGESGGGPYRVGVPVSDTMAGLTAAFAIAAALNNPKRHGEEPQGAYLDISMLESVILGMGWAASDYTVSGKIPEQNGNHSGISCPSGTFRTQDGMINIGTNTQQQWENLATLLKHPEWISKPEFKDRASRVQNRSQVIACLESVLTQKPTAEWVAAIAPLKIPVGEIYPLNETLSLPQIQDRHLLQTMPLDHLGRNITIAKPAVTLNNENPDFTTPPPILSQDTDTILQTMLNMDDATLQCLRENGVIV